MLSRQAEREVGGRTYTQRFANVTVDVGGTAIYSKNRYMAGPWDLDVGRVPLYQFRKPL